MKIRRYLTTAALFVVTSLLALFWLFPLYWAVKTSLVSESQTIARPPSWFPAHITFAAFRNVLENSPIVIWYINSIVTGLIITVATLLLSAMCAYALSQLRFKGRSILFWLVLAGFMIPLEANAIPLYMLLNRFGLVNSYAGIILPQLAFPAAVIIYKRFFDDVPQDFRDAARLDGANDFRILFQVYLPINWGITWAIAIIVFIVAWNNFFWPFVIVTSTDKMTIPVGITQVQSAYGITYANQMATAVLAAVPVVIAYLFFQKRITEGVMSTTALK
ncbi:carbohydrate ABC transporter permease [Salinisphaera sp.]|uniref:carbohydrate ABC transporter permease n=1 Tax=Salinisphaera sp. TaxID=1914330 RepID=UPI002D778658|nr:carbohydrate ABC transporter permease [Salinisphaera sp.]HET7312766.1 carbohydrate ABC transporter permease [Salinisphaera sp.]